MDYSRLVADLRGRPELGVEQAVHGNHAEADRRTGHPPGQLVGQDVEHGLTVGGRLAVRGSFERSTRREEDT